MGNKISKVQLDTAKDTVFEGLKKNKFKIKDMEILSSNIDEFINNVKKEYLEKNIKYPGDTEIMKNILKDGVQNVIPHIAHLVALETKIQNTKD